jgi:hypothetical protein
MTTTVTTSAERDLMEVMRQLSLAMALVADARDHHRPEQAAAAQVYLRQALSTLDRLAQRPVAV